MSCGKKKKFATLNVKVTARADDQEMAVLIISSELLILFSTKCGLMIHHHKPECPMKKKNERKRITVFKVKVEAKGQIVYICPHDLFLTVKHFVINLGIVMHHHKPGCHAKRLVCYFHGQGHSKGS